MNRKKYSWLYDVLFLLVLVLAGYLRLTGVNWGEGQHQHPDENFLVGVLGSLQAHKCADATIPVEACPPEQKQWLGIGDYFNSKTSTLNPYNRGYAFFVYGNLPMTIVRVAAEASNQFDMKTIGRQFSALADLFTILILYFIVARLYDRRVALLAALLSALTVMQIQQSHFFTTDLFVNPFAFLAIYFAVAILDSREQRIESSEIDGVAEPSTPSAQFPSIQSLVSNPLFLYSLGFGVAYGMALASKVNIYPLALLLPGAFALRYFITDRKTQTADDQPQTENNESPSAVSGQRSLSTDYWMLIAGFLIVGGLAALISFRIFQPYAFDGLMPSQQWIANIQEQRVQAKGDADLPWNLQWARRNHLYSFVNLTVWGLGLPLGILAWLGFLYMGWRILKGEWRHALLWGWTALYFIWQSMQFNPTMRYQLPIYPLLVMMAAWFVFELAKSHQNADDGYEQPLIAINRLRSISAVFVGIVVVSLTAAWAFAFQSIYVRDEPRMAASRWIFQNIPGPINLEIQKAGTSTYNQPLPFPAGVYIQPQAPYQTSFVPQNEGLLKEVTLAHVAAMPAQLPAQLMVTVWQNLSDPQPITSAFTIVEAPGEPGNMAQFANFDQLPLLVAGQTYYLKFEMMGTDGQINVCGLLHVNLQVNDQSVEQVIDVSAPCTVALGAPYNVSFIPQVTGSLSEIRLENVDNADLSSLSETHTLDLAISKDPNLVPEQILAGASVTGTFAPSTDPRGDTYTFTLDTPIAMELGTQYYLRLQTDSGLLSVTGAAVANETDYDYGLPFRIDSYDAFGGIYRGDLNLQVYWDDNADKLNRFVNTLDQTDYIFIPTNHQYAQITRLPERYPLTTYYYRELMGCPLDQEIIPCYHEAKPGDHDGRLGFELVAVFETFPMLGNFEINDQYAEEAFTFYDHPKVLIFKKSADFDAEQVRASLSTVDLTKVTRLTPRQFDGFSNLLLPADKLASQRAGGTWSELFNYDWVQNKYPVVGLIIWYIFIFILGLATYPIIRLAMPGLADKGYPLSRALGLLIFGYIAWLASSVGVLHTRITIAIVFGVLLIVSASLAYYQRDELREEWRAKRKYFLMAEGLFLAFFLIDLLIRIGNPDLWHPAKGGERPMDFSYFNAVIKSTSFPPYDPWFAGGYINYYYYGFVLAATPVKLLGIVPSIAYNFILPTLFAMVGTGAFSIGWNLLNKDEQVSENNSAFILQPSAFTAGLSASVLTILLGNLGTIQLIYNRLQQLGSLGTFSWTSTFTQRLTWAIEGLKLTFTGATLPVGPGDWYWDPSRVIPPLGGNEITEFPLFTFVYSDLHAHMIVMPIALLAISWALSVLMTGASWQKQAHPESDRRLSIGLSLLVGGLIIGAAYPTNLSDSYTYLLIGIVALAYSIWRYAEVDSMMKRIAFIGGAVVALYLLSTYLYLPYRAWYSQAYSSLDPWKGPFTPLASYFTHWGLLLFVVVAWMIWETREWLASTPLSALRKLKPYQLLIEGALIFLVLVLLGLQYKGTSVGWIALPIAAWAGVLLLNPNLPDAKRFVLFLIGTALFITIIVEIFVVRGDIGRANTIFKFYLQAWLMLAVSAGAAFAWTLPAFFQWLPGWRAIWQTGMVFLVAGAAMFTITGITGKIRDRWIIEAPRTLDAMTFMNYANYDIFGQRLDLSEDYRAIRWMQENVQGSPVIVEANDIEYHWGTRFTIYTGLPGVVGWNFHQRQQRAYTSTWVEERVASVGNFYNSVDVEFTRNFLKTYTVKYIIVGQLERAEYTPEGIAKFEQYDGVYWKSVYRDGRTVIYEVLP